MKAIAGGNQFAKDNPQPLVMLRYQKRSGLEKTTSKIENIVKRCPYSAFTGS